jgi:hypothetical protein
MMDEGECKKTEAAFVRLIASLVAAAWLMSLDSSSRGDCSADECGNWRSSGALNGGDCGMRAGKIFVLARARTLPVERQREQLVRVRSSINGDGITRNRS